MTERQVLDDYGSYIVRGPKYAVLECRGPVRYRQQLASVHGVGIYFEAHMNATANRSTQQHGFCVTGQNPPPGTFEFAHAVLRRVEYKFGVRNAGLLRGAVGAGNVQWVKWPTPTLLLEPMFVSDPAMAERLALGGGALDDLATCIMEAVTERFPQGALVGVSKGHLYRGNGDTGAPVAQFDADGDGDMDLDPKFDTEGELVEFYVDSFIQQILRCV